MSETPGAESPGAEGLPMGLEALQKSWGWFLVFGIALVVVGTLAISFSFVAGMATVVVFGTLLLVAGGIDFVGAFFCRKWRGFFTELLTGILYLVVGLLMINNPVDALAALTLMIAMFLLASGVLRVVVAVTERFEGWGWLLVSGLVTGLLGVLIWQRWPWSGLWVIGLFVGIEMLLSGFRWVMLAMAAKRLGSLGL